MMKKRLLALLLAVTLTFGILPTVWAVETDPTEATECTDPTHNHVDETVPETTAAATAPVLPADADATQPSTEATQEPTVPETTAAATEPEVTEEPTVPETTETPTEPEEKTHVPEAQLADITVDAAGVPSDVDVKATVVQEEQHQIAAKLLSSFADVSGNVCYLESYNISAEQNGAEWQPAAGETVTLTLETETSGFNIRSYAYVVHFLDTVDAIKQASSKGTAIVYTADGLNEIFTAETAAAVAADYGEDTIVYEILSSEDGDVSVNTNGDIHIETNSFSNYTAMVFNINNSRYVPALYGTEDPIKLDKTVNYNAEDGFSVELEAYTTGKLNSSPTDVVLVIDHSGSMWTAVDCNQPLKFSDIKTDTTHGARRGYYVAFDPVEAANTHAYLIHYTDGKWTRSEGFGTDYSESGKSDPQIDASQGFINTVYSYDRGFVELTDEYAANLTFYKSISGALFDSLNAFMEEMENAVNCRVAVVTFAGTRGSVNEGGYNGSGIFINGTLTTDNNLTLSPALQSTQYEDAFEDPSSEAGQEILYKTIENINTNYGSTPTALGLLYARRLFIQASNSDRNKVAIVFTDGLPSPAYLVGRTAETKNLSEKYTDNYSEDQIAYETDGKTLKVWTSWEDQAERLRNNQGATVYSIGPTAGRAGIDVLSGIASDSSKFYNAAADDMVGVFRDIAGVVVNASTPLDENSYLKDVVSADFKLPDGISASNVEAYIVPCVGENYAFETDEAKWERIENRYITIDTATNSVSVRGFDFSNETNFVAAERAGGKKMLVRIPIVANSDGKIHTATNTTDSAITSGGGEAIRRFPVPHADLPATVELSKQVLGANADKNKDFSFTVKYTGITGYTNIETDTAVVIEEGVTYSNYQQATTAEKTDSTIKLSDGESAEVSGIMLGTKLYVSETDNDGYKVKVYVNNVEYAGAPVDGFYEILVTAGMKIKFENTYQFADLEIQKTVTDSDELALDPNQSFLFRVVGAEETNKNFSMNLTINGEGKLTIANLPVGKYTVTEDTHWSWRYDLTKVETESGKGAKVDKGWTVELTPDGETVTFTNDRERIYWMDGNAYNQNIFN